MYNKNVAITGCTIEKTTKYDYFREDKIRMELYRIILSLYSDGCRTFTGRCPEIILSAVIPETGFPADTDRLYCALYDDLIKQADSKEQLSEKGNTVKVLSGCHIICYYNDLCPEIGQVRASGIPYANIRKMI